MESRIKTREKQVPNNKNIIDKALGENEGLKDELQVAKEACHIEKAERESERTFLLRQLVEADEKLKMAEAERDSIIDQIKKGKEAWAKEARAYQAEEKKGYMMVIKHVEVHFPYVSFESYELHPNMDNQPPEVWQADRFCIYGKISTDDDSDLEGDEDMTKELRPKKEAEDLDDALSLSNLRREEVRLKARKYDLTQTKFEDISLEDERANFDQIIEEIFAEPLLG